jgi:hypothetical protein
MGGNALKSPDGTVGRTKLYRGPRGEWCGLQVGEQVSKRTIILLLPSLRPHFWSCHWDRSSCFEPWCLALPRNDTFTLSGLPTSGQEKFPPSFYFSFPQSPPDTQLLTDDFRCSHTTKLLSRCAEMISTRCWAPGFEGSLRLH